MKNSDDTPIRRDELTSLLSLCGTLAGLCIGIVAFINASHRGAATAIDDVLAICAATFLLCIYLITFALRTRSHKRAALLAQVIELLFLAALTVMFRLNGSASSCSGSTRRSPRVRTSCCWTTCSWRAALLPSPSGMPMATRIKAEA